MRVRFGWYLFEEKYPYERPERSTMMGADEEYSFQGLSLEYLDPKFP
jgi:hypothetical protein